MKSYAGALLYGMLSVVYAIHLQALFGPSVHPAWTGNPWLQRHIAPGYCHLPPTINTSIAKVYKVWLDCPPSTRVS